MELFETMLRRVSAMSAALDESSQVITVDRQKALDFGANELVDLNNDALEDLGTVDLVFDVIGDDIRSVPQLWSDPEERW